MSANMFICKDLTDFECCNHYVTFVNKLSFKHLRNHLFLYFWFQFSSVPAGGGTAQHLPAHVRSRGADNRPRFGKIPVCDLFLVEFNL